MDYFKERTCNKSGEQWRQYSSLQKCPCEICVAERKQNQKPKQYKKNTPIKKVSDKGKELNKIYLQLRKAFLNKPENKICPVTGKPTVEVHHMKKRRGFADEAARYENIPLLLDTRYWLAVSREGHQKIENDVEWAYEMGYSIRNNSNQ